MTIRQRNRNTASVCADDAARMKRTGPQPGGEQVTFIPKPHNKNQPTCPGLPHINILYHIRPYFARDIPLHRPCIDLIYGRYLQFRFLKWPLICGYLLHSYGKWAIEIDDVPWDDRWYTNRMGCLPPINGIYTWDHHGMIFHGIIHGMIMVVYTGWWFQTWLLFSPIVGMMIQSDFHIFQGGWNHQPVSRFITSFPISTQN